MDTPVQPAGPPVASAQEEFCSFTLLFLKEILSNHEFLVDSGASISVFLGPRSSDDDGVCLLTAEGSPMIWCGTCIIPLRFSCSSGSKVYTWNFQLAHVSVPLLGADFLEDFNLLVDIKGLELIHMDCPTDVVFQALPGPQPVFKSVSFLSAPKKIQELLNDILVSVTSWSCAAPMA